jgi:AraC family transcriptional regulator
LLRQNRDLSLAELASVVNISPTYFASLFKPAMGISLHQYAIQQLEMPTIEIVANNAKSAFAD